MYPVMVLAAGLGTRMRPITDTLPKPLVQVGGQTMLDRVLDTFVNAGISQAVINTHYLPEQIEAHCKARRGAPEITLSPEIDERLETGGGIARALPLLGETFFSTNADSFWVADDNAARAMQAAFDPSAMDMLLLVAPCEKSVGMGSHPGDFSCNEAGQLARRGAEPAPYNYTGTAIMSASIFTDLPDGPFSLNLLFDRAIASGRLYGHVLEGLWLTVGTPQAITEAETALKQAGHI
ncbi:nucleotidyltransferase family protein [Ahrensia marina]|uniref:nucleotidyltransferase family protein n=1 Tax=Ahrensia marina TaxID=1514904 RepID=UPI0035CED19B